MAPKPRFSDMYSQLQVTLRSVLKQQTTVKQQDEKL